MVIVRSYAKELVLLITCRTKAYLCRCFWGLYSTRTCSTTSCSATTRTSSGGATSSRRTSGGNSGVTRDGSWGNSRGGTFSES